MAYYAQLVNKIVTDVIVVNDDVPDGSQFCTDLLGGVWVQTYMDDPDKTYAGVGYTYNLKTKDFVAPIPDPIPEQETT